MLTALIERPRPAGLPQQRHASRRHGLAARHRLERAALGLQPGVLREQAVSDALALAVARRWPDVLSNAVDPGWVPTKMGGPGAPDDLETGLSHADVARGER